MGFRGSRTTNGHQSNSFTHSQPSELVEFTAKGKFIGQFSISTQQGGAFGVATSSTRTQFAAVNDITNSVVIWTV